MQQLPWSGAAIGANHGVHHRYEDEQFGSCASFLDPANELRRQGALEFVFDAEVARLQQESEEHFGVFECPDFTGPLRGIPGVFRAAF